MIMIFIGKWDLLGIYNLDIKTVRAYELRFDFESNNVFIKKRKMQNEITE